MSEHDAHLVSMFIAWQASLLGSECDYLKQLILFLLCLMLYRLEWDMWFAMSLIGMTVGIVGFMMHETVEVITHNKWTRAFYHIQVWFLIFLHYQ